MQTCKSFFVGSFRTECHTAKSPGFEMAVSMKGTEKVNALQLKLKESLLSVKHAALTVALAHQTFQSEVCWHVSHSEWAWVRWLWSVWVFCLFPCLERRRCRLKSLKTLAYRRDLSILPFSSSTSTGSFVWMKLISRFVTVGVIVLYCLWAALIWFLPNGVWADVSLTYMVIQVPVPLLFEAEVG